MEWKPNGRKSIFTMQYPVPYDFRKFVEMEWHLPEVVEETPQSIAADEAPFVVGEVVPPEEVVKTEAVVGVSEANPQDEFTADDYVLCACLIVFVVIVGVFSVLCANWQRKRQEKM